MYYIEESHEPIIPLDKFGAVQAEIERRKEMGTAIRSSSPFSSKIICGDCGAHFGKKIWSSTSEKYRKEAWRCNALYKKKVNESAVQVTLPKKNQSTNSSKHLMR